MAIVDAIAGPAVSKVDLAEFRHEVRNDITELRNEVGNDIAELRNEMRVEISNVRSEVKAGIAEAKSDLTRLIPTVATGQLALLLAAMFSLARLGR